MIRTLLLTASLILAVPVLAPAQIAYSPVQMKTFNGTVESVGKLGIVANIDGKSQPVPMSPQTILNVQAIGDSGFVRVGSTVTVSGALVPGGGLAKASITVHANPAVTAQPKILAMTSDARSMTVTGMVTSLNPFIVDVKDLLRPTIKGGNVGIQIKVPPVPGGPTAVQPSEKFKEKVNVLIGPAIGQVSAGDNISVTFSQANPNVAYRVTVTKKDEISSTVAADEEKSKKKKK